MPNKNYEITYFDTDTILKEIHALLLPFKDLPNNLDVLKNDLKTIEEMQDIIREIQGKFFTEQRFIHLVEFFKGEQKQSEDQVNLVKLVKEKYISLSPLVKKLCELQPKLDTAVRPDRWLGFNNAFVPLRRKYEEALLSEIEALTPSKNFNTLILNLLFFGKSLDGTKGGFFTQYSPIGKKVEECSIQVKALMDPWWEKQELAENLDKVEFVSLFSILNVLSEPWPVNSLKYSFPTGYFFRNINGELEERGGEHEQCFYDYIELMVRWAASFLKQSIEALEKDKEGIIKITEEGWKQLRYEGSEEIPDNTITHVMVAPRTLGVNL